MKRHESPPGVSNQRDPSDDEASQEEEDEQEEESVVVERKVEEKVVVEEEEVEEEEEEESDEGSEESEESARPAREANPGDDMIQAAKGHEEDLSYWAQRHAHQQRASKMIINPPFNNADLYEIDEWLEIIYGVCRERARVVLGRSDSGAVTRVNVGTGGMPCE